MPWTQQPADVALAKAMSGAWVGFATTGDPAGAGLPTWQEYEPAQEPYLEFGDTIRAGQHLLKAQCDFFDDHMAAQRAAAAR